jgi:hypothetical protein
MNTIACSTNLMATGADKAHEPAVRMAMAIVKLIQKNGDCLPQDLLAYGFTKDETVELWHLARSIAAIELKLMREKGKQ